MAIKVYIPKEKRVCQYCKTTIPSSKALNPWCWKCGKLWLIEDD